MGVIRDGNVGSDYNYSLTNDKIRENNHCFRMEVNYIECYSLHDSGEPISAGLARAGKEGPENTGFASSWGEKLFLWKKGGGG